MDNISEIQNLISLHQKIVDECNSNIARLEPIYKEFGSIKNSFRSTRSNTEDIFKEKGNWQGETHTTFCNDGAGLDGSLGDYYKKLDVAQDAVNKAIAQLKAKKWEQFPIINGLVAEIEAIKSDVENALN